MTISYQQLLSDIRKSLDETGRKPIEAEDVQLTSTVATQKSEVEYIKRDNLYTDLLGNYIDIYKTKEKHKKVFKIVFFVVVMLIFVGVIAGCVVSMCYISINGIYDMESVGIVIADIAGIISSVVIIPQIIAKHLFPTNEENFMLDMVKSMQNNDAGIRNYIYSGEKKKKKKNRSEEFS